MTKEKMVGIFYIIITLMIIILMIGTSLMFLGNKVQQNVGLDLMFVDGFISFITLSMSIIFRI